MEPINAIVVADNSRANNRVLNAIGRSIEPLHSIVTLHFHGTLEKAREEVRTFPGLYPMAIVDGNTANNDFNAVAALMPEQPVIVLHDPRNISHESVVASGVQPELVISRPFHTQQLTGVVQRLSETLTAAPAEGLRGLFTNKACTCVFLDGKPLAGFMDVEREMLRFLIDNGKALTPQNFLPNFSRSVLGGHSNVEEARGVLRNFCGRMARTLDTGTGGRYCLESTQENGVINFVRLVEKPQAAAQAAPQTAIRAAAHKATLS